MANTETATTPSNGKEDKLTAAIGVLGRWQIFLFVIMAFPVKISAVWTIMDIIFLAPKTTFRCLERDNATDIVNETCYDDCKKYEYISDFDQTIISDWGLICDRAWLAHFAQTIAMFGIVVGSIIFGFVSDRYGRRLALNTGCTMQLLMRILVPFSESYWMLCVIRFIMGMATSGIMMTSFVILVEIIGQEKRELMNAWYHVPLALGEMLLPLFAYYLRSWWTYSIGLAIPNFIFLVYYCVIPESPKWLISVGKVKEASVEMEKIAKRNGLPTDNMLNIATAIHQESQQNSKEIDIQEKVTYFDLINVASLRWKNLCSCIAWFVLGISFYGCNQYIGQTSENPFISVLLAGALQIPGNVISGYVIKWIGRRKGSIVFFVISGVCNGLLAVPDDYYYVKLVAGSIGMGCSAGAFCIIYIYTTELFPTVARNMAMGASSMVSRIGSMLAPFIAGLSVQAEWIPPLVFCGAPLIAAATMLFLPETKGKKLEDHVDRN